MQIKIGMLKAMPKKWDVEENWAIFEKQFETHGGETDIFITPECFLDGYAVTEKIGPQSTLPKSPRTSSKAHTSDRYAKWRTHRAPTSFLDTLKNVRDIFTMPLYW